MRLAMLSQDRLVLEEGSPVSHRIASYGALADEVVVIVFGGGERRERVLAPNVVAVAPGGTGKVSALFAGYRELARVTALKAYDLISAQDPFFIGFAGFLIARKRGIALQLQIHTDCFSGDFALASPRRLIEVACAGFLIPRASCIRVVSERIAKSVRKLTKKPVSVLPIRVEAPLYEVRREREPLHEGPLKLLAVSRLTKEKQVHLIIDAIARTEGAALTIVGDGPLRKALEQRAGRLGVAARVHFAGWKDPAPYYADADAFAQMSRFEGYGRTLIEAALAGLPIITTDVGIVGEVLSDGKEAIVVSSDAQALARAIAALIKDPARREALGAGAEKAARAEQSSEAEYLARYKEVIHTCTI